MTNSREASTSVKKSIADRTMAQNSTNQERSLNFIVIFLCWAIPMGWVTAIPNKSSSPNAAANHSEEPSLRLGGKIIKKFQDQFAVAPQNLNELRAYALSIGYDFSPWDSYGERLDYLRLGEDSWFLRSFGFDRRQNTLMTSQDPVASSISNSQGQGVHQINQDHADRYNPALLTGALSSQLSWHAQIYFDPLSGASRLLVRHRKKKNYFMISKYRTVEEFYWIPDGYRIVFTVTGSNRYKDGVYLWNLLTDRTTNIFPGSNNIGAGDLAHSAKKWIFSLAGVLTSPTRVLVFKSQHINQPLDLKVFFRKENLLSITISDPTRSSINNQKKSALNDSSVGGLKQTNPESTANVLSSISLQQSSHLYHHPLSNRWTPSSGIYNCDKGIPLQKNWCHLPTSGAFQTAISAWQIFAENVSTTPIFPYALFQLSSLYSDAYALLLGRLRIDPDDDELARNADLLRSYGAEITRALANLTTAPAWLRNSAWYNLERFNQHTPFTYVSSSIEIID